ncbi:BrnT family toxin [soil metagenome]
MDDDLFDWDPVKARTNLIKHGVSFIEARAVFGDYWALDAPDIDHSDEEDRWIILGRSNRDRLIIVAYAERGEKFRIISARRATPSESNGYERRIK